MLWRYRIIWGTVAALMIAIGAAFLQPYEAAVLAGTRTRGSLWIDPFFLLVFMMLIAGIVIAVLLAGATFQMRKRLTRLNEFVREGPMILRALHFSVLKDDAPELGISDEETEWRLRKSRWETDVTQFLKDELKDDHFVNMFRQPTQTLIDRPAPELGTVEQKNAWRDMQGGIETLYEIHRELRGG